MHGHRLAEWPKHPNLVVDASSEIMSRPHPVARSAIVYAGAQKNLGPAGVVVTIVRKDLYDRIAKSVPKICNFKAHAEAKSCLNTPPTFGIYMLLETFRWLERQGGLAAMEKRNADKAKLIYDAIDGSGGFYKGTVADKAARSHMNVTFRLPSEELTDEFVKEARPDGMVALKGYRTVGGIRASIYNAMPVAGAEALADFMGTFAKAADSRAFLHWPQSKSCSSLDDVDQVPMRPTTTRAARRPGVAGHTSKVAPASALQLSDQRRSRSRPRLSGQAMARPSAPLALSVTMFPPTASLTPTPVSS